MKRTAKLTALLLSFLMVAQFTLFPVAGEQALDTSQEIEALPTIQAPTATEEVTEPYAVGEEIEAWREEGVRHYYLGDGVYEAIVTAEPSPNIEAGISPAEIWDDDISDPDVIEDTYISSSHKSLVYGEENTLWVGLAETGLFWFAEPDLPDNATFMAGTLYFYYYYYVDSGYLDISSYPVSIYWSESYSWNDMSEEAESEGVSNLGIGTTAVDTTSLNAAPSCNASNPTRKDIDVSSIVEQWYSGELYNDGIALKRTGGDLNSVILKPHEAGSEYQPCLKISYKLVEESEGYIPSGEYYLQNVQSNRYAQLNDNIASNPDDEFLEIHDFDAADDQKWKFENLHNNYYKITCVDSGKVLTAPASVNDNITQAENTLAHSQQWKITKTTDGYKISPRSNISYYMAVTTTGSGSNVKMKASLSNNRDEWYILPVTYAYSVGGEFFNGADVIDASNSWAECHHISSYDINPSPSSLSKNNLNSDVVYFSAHGTQHSITLLNDIHLKDQFSTATSNIVISNYTLPKAKLYIYDACETAKTTETDSNNLCTETIAAGVDCVIGWTQMINFDDARAWQARFQSRLIAGDSVIAAANYANTFTYEFNELMKSWRIYGAQDMVINNHIHTPPSYEDDKTLTLTSIEFGEYNLDTLKSILSTTFESYTNDAAFIITTYTNADKTNYVIDYLYAETASGQVFASNSGYSVIIQDGIITHMRDHTVTASANAATYSISPSPVITPEIIELAYAQATLEVKNMSENYEIVEQNGEYFYDAWTGTYYYKIMTTYMTPYGTYGGNSTLYELS